jgi:sigma54-dependent transcription regulator
MLIDILAGLEFTRGPSDAVRLISGTTVSLLERIAGGTFSDQLFYRLNIIHLTAADGLSSVTGADDAQHVHVIEPLAPTLPR